MKKLEYFIIGQGLAGTILAFEMLKNGIDFRIISSPQKSKASLVAAGMVNPLVFKRLTKSWMVDELLPEMIETYRQLEEKLEESFYFEKKILKPLSEPEKELWLERKKNPEFSNYIGEISDEAPIELLKDSSAFAQVKGAGYLNLKHFLMTAENYFRKFDLIIDSEFQEIEPNKTTYQQNGFSADKLVFCEGFHLKKNPLFDFVKLNPEKGEVLQICAPELSEEFILNKKAFVLPIGNHRFKVGSTYEWKDLSEKTTGKGKVSILERLDNLILADYKIEQHWAGVRPTVIDRRPILGVHPENRNIFIFNGLGTKGVMLAPYFTSGITNFIKDKNYSLSPEVDVQRFC